MPIYRQAGAKSEASSLFISSKQDNLASPLNIFKVFPAFHLGVSSYARACLAQGQTCTIISHHVALITSRFSKGSWSCHGACSPPSNGCTSGSGAYYSSDAVSKEALLFLPDRISQVATQGAFIE